MKEHEYFYRIRPLVFSGVLYLLLFPVTVVFLHFFLSFPPWELRLLAVLYGFSACSILGLWLFARSKRIIVGKDKIIFSSRLGAKVIGSADLRRVVFSEDQHGQEMVFIRTKTKDFFVTAHYFPYQELMSDLDTFIKRHRISINYARRR